MKSAIRNTCALLCAVSLLGTSAAGMTAAAAFSEDTLKGTFCQSNVTVGDMDYGFETYTYSDSYFFTDTTYQPQLATASACLAMASTTSSRVDATHAADRDIIAFLEDIGFTDVQANEDFRSTPTEHTIGVACGRKTLTDENGQTYTLLAVAPRGAGYGAEWASNFRLGADGNAAGFTEASEKVLAFLQSYAAAHEISGNLKLWITGYSRAGAVANLTAATLLDNPSAVFGDGISLPPEQIYAYTFEAPKAADIANHPRGEQYRTIYNIVSKNDAIPCIAPANLGFDRYGTDHIPEDNTETETSTP